LEIATWRDINSPQCLNEWAFKGQNSADWAQEICLSLAGGRPPITVLPVFLDLCAPKSKMDPKCWPIASQDDARGRKKNLLARVDYFSRPKLMGSDQSLQLARDPGSCKVKNTLLPRDLSNGSLDRFAFSIAADWGAIDRNEFMPS
jgi:hypothetical protein